MGPIFRASCVIVLSLSFVHTSEQRQKIEPSCSGLNTTVRLSDPSLVLTQFDKVANCSSGYFLESFSNRSLNLTLSVQSQLSDFVPFFFGFTFMDLQIVPGLNINSHQKSLTRTSCSMTGEEGFQTYCSVNASDLNISAYWSSFSAEMHRNAFIVDLKYKNESNKISSCLYRMCIYPFIWTLPDALEVYEVESARKLSPHSVLKLQRADGTRSVQCRVSNIRLPPSARLEWLVNGVAVPSSANASSEPAFPTFQRLEETFTTIPEYNENPKKQDLREIPGRSSLVAALSFNHSTLQWDNTGAVRLTCRLRYQLASSSSYRSTKDEVDIIIEDAEFTTRATNTFVPSSSTTALLILSQQQQWTMPETASHTEQGPPANGMHYGYESRDDERVPLTPPPPDRNARATVPQPLPVGDGGGASSRETTLLFRSEDLPLLLIGVVCIVALLLMLVNVFVVFGLVCKQRKRARRQSKDQRRAPVPPAIFAPESLDPPALVPLEDDPTGLEFGGRLPPAAAAHAPPPERSSRRSLSSLAEQQCRDHANASRSYMAFDEALVPLPLSHTYSATSTAVAQCLIPPPNCASSHYMQSQPQAQAQVQTKEQTHTQAIPVVFQPFPLAPQQQTLLSLPTSSIYSRQLAAKPPPQGTTILKLPNTMNDCSLESLRFDHLTHAFDKQMERLEENPLMSCSPHSDSSHQQVFECGEGFRIGDSLPPSSVRMQSPVSHAYPKAAASDGAPSRASSSSFERRPGSGHPHSLVEMELPSPDVLPSQLQRAGQVLVLPPATLPLGTAINRDYSNFVPGADMGSDAAHRLLSNWLPQRPGAVVPQSLGLRRELLADHNSPSPTPTSNFYPMASLERFAAANSALPRVNSDANSTGVRADSFANATITAIDAV